MNTERYCPACNEKTEHADGCEIAALTQRLARATVLLQRVHDKEQAKQELQGFMIFRAPNTLLEDIRAFLTEREKPDYDAEINTRLG